VFPDLRPADYGSWTGHKIVVQRTAKHRDASIEALGVGSTATGGRADIIIADDVVDRRNALQFPAIREAVKQAWFSDYVQLLEPNGRIIYICTLWHRKDLSHELMKNNEYEVLRVNVTEDLKPIWPEVWSKERLEQRKREIGTIEFNRGFRNIAIDDETCIIRRDWIKFYKVAPKFDEMIQSWDLSFGGITTTASYVVGQVWGKAGANKYLVDQFRAKIGFNEQITAIKTMSGKWPQATLKLIENKANGKAAIDVLKKSVDGIVAFEPSQYGSKENRLLAVQPQFEAGNVFIPDPTICSWAHDYIEELATFPIGDNDDQVDSTSQALIRLSKKVGHVFAFAD